MEAPKWYNQGPIECIDAMESAFSQDEIAAFCRINAFKYVWRCTTHKDDIDVNIRKAIWFLEHSLDKDPKPKPNLNAYT